MKLCPKCSTKNDSTANFCKGCGENLSEVPITQEDISSIAGSVLNKAKEIASAGAKMAQQVAADGAVKAKEAVEAGREKMQSVSSSKESPTSYIPERQSRADAGQTSDSPNSGWDSTVSPSGSANVTTKRYPFFKDENTVAVLGEEAAMSDLEGSYTKPYAVLTQRHLYVKNESGNFITEISEMRAIGYAQPAKGMAIVWWLSFVLSFISILLLLALRVSPVFLILSMIASVYFRKFRSEKNPQNWFIAQGLLSAGPILTALIVPKFALIGIVISIYEIFLMAIGYWTAQKSGTYSDRLVIRCVGGTFSFISGNYPQQEFSDFRVKAAKARSGKASISSYQPNRAASYGTSRVGKQVLTTICVLVVLVGIVCFAWYSLTHCKVSGCDQEVYENGYCKYHYSVNKVDNAVHGAFDSADSFFGDLFGK